MHVDIIDKIVVYGFAITACVIVGRLAWSDHRSTMAFLKRLDEKQQTKKIG